MFIRKPGLRRTVASLLLVQTITQLGYPIASYALTAGPTAPEATSFEPVDTTDMVNLSSGDLTYNIPLLEIPGPEGGYPLSLAYHAGIQPDVEASWVGLGWSLNPGAINRNVNGYADDQQNAGQVAHDYWVGGDQKTYTVGVGVGIGQGASVSAGLSFSNDTYRGFGVGGYVGANIGIGGDKSPVGLSTRASVDGYGNTGAGVSVGIGTKGAMSAGASVGLSTNFNSISTNAGVGISAMGNSIMGASISSGGGKLFMTGPGGSTGVRNDKAGRIQTESNGFDIAIPIPGTPVFVALGYNNIRYWSDETSVAGVNGVLYYPLNSSPIANDISQLDDQAYDTYRLLDPKHANIADNNDADKLSGGSLPNFDNYSVVAQGLAGSMRPYAYQEALYSRNRKEDGHNMINNAPLPWVNKPMQFRFENDFSNSYRQENGILGNGYSFSSYTFNSPEYGNQDGTNGYSTTENRLAGSKHIEYYTNSQLTNGTPINGFIETQARGFNRQSRITSHPEIGPQIGGFSITNPSGVTYHFALPAYAYEEYTRVEKIDEPGTYNELTKNSYYAYTWHLTAVTGPDYVDRGTPGLDAEDWGYWVGFNYGLWSDHYGWRNPAQGTNLDVDSNTKIYSRGRREVYYLNSISTRTHTAIFEKELRTDAQSATHAGFLPDTRRISHFPPLQVGGRNITYTNQTELLSKSLRLSKIYLLNNIDVPSDLETRSPEYNISNETDYIVFDSRNSRYYRNLQLKSQLGQNIIDSKDIDAVRQQLISSSIRVIDLKHDYSLTPNTSNSIKNDGALAGKLTLKSIGFLGEKGIGILPDTRFAYDLPRKTGGVSDIEILSTTSNGSGPVAVNNIGTIAILSNNIFDIGDIVQFNSTNGSFYFTILERWAGTGYKVRYLNNITNLQLGRYQAFKTKNPPYSADNHDWWGMFKSDYDNDFDGYMEAYARRTTEVSSKAVDAWSLRGISSPLGSNITINYESDRYSKKVIARPNLINRTYGQGIQGPSDGLGNLETPFTISQASSIYKIGQRINVTGIAFDRPSTATNRHSFVSDVPMIIKSINDFSITVEDINQTIFQNYVTCNSTNGVVNCSRQLSVGYISLPSNDMENWGGGLRVKSVETASNGNINKTEYNYDNNSLTGSTSQINTSSGVTSYEPGAYMNLKDARYNSVMNASGVAGMGSDYRDFYSNSLPYLFAVTREIPAPGVMYSTVSVKESSMKPNGSWINSPNSWMYRFDVFDENMIGHKVITTNFGTNSSGGSKYGTNVSIKDFTSRVGSLRSVTRYGSDGKKLSETTNHYLHDQLAGASYEANSNSTTGYQPLLAPFNYQGVIQESFGDSRHCSVDGDINKYEERVVMTKRDVYPTIQTATITTDFTTGISTTASTLAFDFYSGTATKTLSVDGYGNRFMSETVPAYRQYPAMGLKTTNQSNRHMLSQTSGNITYKVDAANVPVRVVSASAQTWSNGVAVIGTTPTQPETRGIQSGVWRPWQSFAWMPTGVTADGLTPMTGSDSYVAFNPASPAVPWQLTSEITLYNVFSNALEAKDVRSVYLATKLGFNQSKVLMSGGPAKYQEIVYSGAEEERLPNGSFSGNINVTWQPGAAGSIGNPGSIGDGERSTASAHTGDASLRLGSGKHGFSYAVSASELDPTKAYRASVWATNPGAQLYYWVDGQQVAIISGSAQKRTPQGWYLLDLIIPPIGNGRSHLRVGCYNNSSNPNVYFDDFRFQPLHAKATSYVYNKLTGQVAYILDNNNISTYYEYDAASRLVRVKRETLTHGSNLIAEHTYHMAGAPSALDQASLVLAQTSTGNTYPRTYQAQVTVPGDATKYNVLYNPGYSASGSSIYAALPPVATATSPIAFSCTYPSRGTYWIKVRVRDTDNRQRDLVQKIVLP